MNWCKESVIWTQFLDATSVLFPAWERAWVAVAATHRPMVSDALAARIEAFMGDESSHANAHEAYNIRQGLKEAEIAEYKKTKIIHRTPKRKVWLGAMVSIEYLAVCLGRMFLSRFDGETGREFKLFAWHAREEIEHKDLAIDVWRELGYSDKDMRAIARQNQAYVLGFLIKQTVKGVDWMKPKNWVDLADWAWWMTKKVFIPMLAIYLPKFHPNWFDDSRYKVAA